MCRRPGVNDAELARGLRGYAGDLRGHNLMIDIGPGAIGGGVKYVHGHDSVLVATEGVNVIKENERRYCKVRTCRSL